MLDRFPVSLKAMLTTDDVLLSILHKTPGEADGSGGYAVHILRTADARGRDSHICRAFMQRAFHHLPSDLATGQIELLDGLGFDAEYSLFGLGRIHHIA